MNLIDFTLSFLIALCFSLVLRLLRTFMDIEQQLKDINAKLDKQGELITKIAQEEKTIISEVAKLKQQLEDEQTISPEAQQLLSSINDRLEANAVLLTDIDNQVPDSEQSPTS